MNTRILVAVIAATLAPLAHTAQQKKTWQQKQDAIAALVSRFGTPSPTQEDLNAIADMHDERKVSKSPQAVKQSTSPTFSPASPRLPVFSSIPRLD